MTDVDRTTPHGSARKLLTVVCEAALEEGLLEALEAGGARGYTVTDARGKGSRGRRDAAWGPLANIRIEVLCNGETAERLCAILQQQYSEHYSLVLFVSDVQVLRPEKF